MMWSLKDLAAWVRGLFQPQHCRDLCTWAHFSSQNHCRAHTITPKHPIPFYWDQRELFFCEGNFVFRQPGRRRCENARKISSWRWAWAACTLPASAATLGLAAGSCQVRAGQRCRQLPAVRGEVWCRTKRRSSHLLPTCLPGVTGLGMIMESNELQNCSANKAKAIFCNQERLIRQWDVQ